MAAESLYSLYKQIKEDTKSLFYLELVQLYKDSVYNKKNSAKIAWLETKYQYEQEKQHLVFEQEKEKLKLEEEKRLLRIRQTTVFIGFGIMVFMTILLVKPIKKNQGQI